MSHRFLTLMSCLFSLATSAAGQGADDCSNAQPISGVGSFVFDNTSATTDGEANPLCAFLGAVQIRNDIWFRWTPPASGAYWVQCCSLTQVDTRIAVYGPTCNSPMTDCNDDDCGFQSRLLVPAVVDQPILIRLGNYPGTLPGLGRLVILPSDPVLNPDNGNHYQIVGRRTTWQAARFDAASRVFQGTPGHLATITSNSENFFVYYNLGAAGLTRYWLGGRQDPFAPTFSEPAGGWVWLTGEILEGAYERWANGEPDDAGGGQNSISYRNAAEWADESDLFLNNDGFIIEYETGGDVGENYCVSVANSTGNPAEITASGSASVTENFLTLLATPVPNQPGIFFFGPFQVLVPFGNGFRCVGGQLVRLSPSVGDNGFLRRSVDFESPSISPFLMAGTTWNFQAWYRDPAGGGSLFNLSDAVELTFEP